MFDRGLESCDLFRGIAHPHLSGMGLHAEFGMPAVLDPRLGFIPNSGQEAVFHSILMPQRPANWVSACDWTRRQIGICEAI